MEGISECDRLECKQQCSEYTNRNTSDNAYWIWAMKLECCEKQSDNPADIEAMMYECNIGEYSP